MEPVEGTVVHRATHQEARDGQQGYKLKFGQEIYYCKPYRPFHTQLRYNFSGSWGRHLVLSYTSP